VRRRREEESGGSWFAIAVGMPGILAIGVGMWWLAALLYASVDGDVLVPVDEGRWAGAPALFLVALFGFGGLAAIGGFGFLSWLMITPRRRVAVDASSGRTIPLRTHRLRGAGLASFPFQLTTA
jgi:hypothetical protein